MSDWKVWRCRWCGRRVHGVWRLFHDPDKCKRRRFSLDEVLDMVGVTREELGNMEDAE